MIKIGSLIKVIGNTNGNNYEIGKIYKVTHINPNGSMRAMDQATNWVGNTINPQDAKIIESSLKELKNQLNEIKKEIQLNEIKLKFLTETKTKRLKQNDFMAWYMLEILNSDDKDKEKKLSRLINTLNNNINVNILKNTF